MNKKLIFGFLALLIGTSVAGTAVSKVYAQESDETLPTMIQEFVERFNLDENEVQQFVQEQHEQRQTEMKERQNDKLEQAVKDGKLTEEQKNMLTAKLEEQRAKRAKEQEEFKVWAEENGIDLSVLKFRHHGPWAGGHRF